MHLFQLSADQTLPISREEAWNFFSNPRNLTKITPLELAMQTTSEIPTEMYEGLIITYKIRPFLDLPLRWVTEITHIKRGELFVDEQRFGPYRFWHHEHHFVDAGRGTRIWDLIHFGTWLPSGRLVELIVIPQLREIFEHRSRVLAELFPGVPANQGMLEIKTLS